jgi:hypothetical protein
MLMVVIVHRSTMKWLHVGHFLQRQIDLIKPTSDSRAGENCRDLTLGLEMKKPSLSLAAR